MVTTMGRAQQTPTTLVGAWPQIRATSSHAAARAD
jgi:hypothetical protein